MRTARVYTAPAWTVALGLIACISSPSTPAPEPQVFTIDAPFDAVWNSAMVWFTDENIPITDFDALEYIPGLSRLWQDDPPLLIGDDLHCGMIPPY